MELLNKFVITLITTLIFIAAVELIAPDNNMKKYLKFVLGLILIAVILNPILTIILNGEEELKDVISMYEGEYNNKKVEKNDDNLSKVKEESFKNNFNKNCENMLKKEFKNLEFKCDVDCVIDFNGTNFTINKLDIRIKDKKIKNVKKIEKIDIDSKERDQETKENDRYKDVVKFISKELEIKEEIINIYIME